MLPSSPVLRPFRYLRQALPWLLALAVATCTADQGGPTASGTGYFSFRPVYQLAGGASLSQFGIVADSVRIRLTRPVAQVVLDTTIFFPPDSTSLRLALPVELQQSPESLTAVISISAGGTIIFTDSIETEVTDGPPGSSTPPTVTFKYVGPGSSIASITILPPDTNVFFGDTLFFTASAIDSSDAAVASFYVGWKSSDTTVAKINANGRLIAPAVRGSVRVIGMTPTGIADTTLVAFSPVPVIITADSGNGQSGLAGDSLAALFVARVKGADSLGIVGIPVKFAAVTAGGAVRDTFTLITDATGRVRTRAFLGTLAGNYSYTATALGTGLPAQTFTATATVALPTAIAIQSGNAQVDTVTQALAPLVVHVTDAFGNDVVGAAVVFTRASGFGILADDTVLTVAGGLASIGYTLGGPVGTDSIRADLAGTSAFVVFTAQGIPDTPAINQLFSGDGQTAAVGAAFAAPLVVRVEDGHNNTVPGAKVGWTVITGLGVLSADTSITDSIGRAIITVTAGTLAGDLQINAQVPGVGAGTTITLHVTAGAPASMVIASGNGQTGPAGVGLPLWPEVQVTDAFANPVSGVSVDFAVVAGGGSIDSATATTDSTGRANSGEWILGPGGLNTVRATTAAVPADTLLYDATSVPAGVTKLWTGAVDNLWTTAGNWSPAGMPVGGDNLFIPAGVTSPVLNTPTITGGLAVESGATVTVTSGVTLQLSGNLQIDGDLTGAGNLLLTGSGTTLSGNISLASVLTNGTLTLSGATAITGPLNVNAGSFTVGGRTLTLGGTLTVGGSGQLLMTNAADSVDVAGNATVNTVTSGTGDLSAGVLVLRGDFTQNSGANTNFAPSGTHLTRFLGAAPQAIIFSSPGSANSRFQDLEFGNAAGVTLNSTITAMGTTTVSAGSVTGIGHTANLGGSLFTTYSAWQVSTTLWGASPAVYPDSLPRNVIVFNGWTLNKPFKADSNLSINSTGVLTLNGNALRVGGTFTQSGVLSMSQAADSLDVQGLFTVNSAISGVADLSDGVIVLRGGLTQTSGATNNFQASGTHRVRFLGSVPQTVAFSSSGVTNSRFAGVEFGDVGGVTFTSNFYAAGAASVTAGTVTGVARTATLAGDLATSYGAWQVSSTLWVGTPAVYPDSLPRNVSLGAALTLSKNFKVDSALTISPAGFLALNGHSMRIGRGLTQTGQLSMQDPADTLDIGGLFTVNSGFSSSALMTEGLLRLRGGLTQAAGAVDNFHSSGNQITRFEAAAGQAVNIGSPGAAAAAFQTLEVADSINVPGNIYVAGNVTLLGSGKVQGNTTATLAGDLVDPSNSGWRYATTQLIGTPTTLPDSMVTNLVIPGSWTLARRTVVDGNVTVTSSGSLTLNSDSLRVTGAFTQTGTLTMTAPADLLDVGGTFTVNSGLSSSGKLTDGRILLHGGLVQSAGAVDNFAPSTPQVTEFAGIGGHALGFGTPSAANSHFAQLVVADSLSVTGNVSVTGSVVLRPTGRMVGPNTGLLLGNLVDSSLAGWRMGTTQLDGKFQLIPSALATNLILNDSIALAQPTTVTGNFTLQNAGYIAFGGHGLGVSGNFTQNSTLEMNSTQDSLDVGGTFQVNSGIDGTGKLAAGVIVLRGGFSQSAGSTTNFMADAPHRVRFTGPGARTIALGTPSSVHFGDLELDSTGTVTINSDVHALGTLKVLGAPVSITAATQRLIRTGGLAVNGLALDRVRIQLNSAANAMQFDNVAFTNQDLTQTQLSLELPGLAGDTLKLNSVAFDGVPTTGRYVFVTDSVADGAVATVAFYNSTPLNGSLYTAVNGTAGDPPSVLWSTLQWQTQPVGGTELLAFVPAPQLKAIDPSGNLASGFTGTVTLGLSTDPSAGAAVLAGNSVAAIGGVATFDSLTLSLAGVGYQLQGNATGLGQGPPSVPFTISVPLPVGTTTAFNNGGGDNDWFNAANWTAGVPDSADNVFVFPGQTATVNSPAQVNRVDIGTGGTIVLNAPLTADSSITAGNTISGGGQLIARGSGTLSGVMGDLQITGNYSVAAGNLSAQTITVGGSGALDLNGKRVDVSGDFGTSGTAVFKMTDPKDSLFVGGNFTADGASTDSLLTAGLLQIAGNFTQSATQATNSFHATSGHLTRFTGGTGVRTIAFSTPVDPSNPFFLNGSAFGDLDLPTGTDSLNSVVTTMGSATIDSASVAGQTLAVNGPLDVLAGAPGLFVSSLYTGGGLNYQPAPGTYSVAETFFFGGPSIPVLPYQWLRVGVATIPMAGDLSVSQVTIGGQGEGSIDSYGGQLVLNGHALQTSGDFTLTGFGTLRMDRPADSLDVGGSFNAAGGSTSGLVTDGVIVARGAVYVAPNWEDSSFIATGANRFRMAGAGAFDLGLIQGTTAANRFSRFTIGAGTTANFNQFQNGALVTTDTLSIAGFLVQASAGQKVTALGDLYVGTSAGITVDTVEVHQHLDVDLSTYSTQLTRYAGTGQSVFPGVAYHDLEITGTAALDSTVFVTNDASVRGAGMLTLAGHALEVTHDLTVADSALLVMTSPADSVNVGYTATFDGRDSEGWLTAGTLTFNYFKQLATTSPKAFRATGAHRAVLLQQNPADATEMVQFATPGAAASQFQEFELSGGSLYAYFGAGSIYVADSLYVPAGGSSGLFGSGTTMTVNGPIVVQTGTIPIQIDTLELRGTIDVPYSSLSNGVTRFAGINQQIPDTQNYNRIEVTGTATLETGGGFVASSSAEISGNGQLSLGASMTFISNGPFTTAGNGTVVMSDPTSELRVFGTATFGGGSTAGKLTDGVLRLYGDLAEISSTSDSAFHPAATHQTILEGDKIHGITFDSPDLNYGANFGTLEVTPLDSLNLQGNTAIAVGRAVFDTSSALVDLVGTGRAEFLAPFEVRAAAGITIADLTVRDSLLVDPSATYNVGRTDFAFYTAPVPAVSYTNVVFEMGAPVLGASISATGSVDVTGDGFPMDLRLNGFTLSAATFGTSVGGAIIMDQPTDSLVVTGDAFFRGGSELGKLSAGAMVFGGNFTQDTAVASPPSSFVTEGTTVEFSLGPTHQIRFATPDSSWLPSINSSGAGTLQMQFVGRTRLAGDLSAYGLDLTGDTLWVDGQVNGGPAGANVTLTMLRTGSIYGGTSFSTFAVGTTQFTDPGQLLSLPYDTLVVSDTLLGSYSQLVTANRLLVTGPGDPLHVGPTAGWLFLQGGDGNTTVNVNGDAIVSGAGATIYNNRGTLTTTGDLLVQQGGLLVATATGCCGTALFDIAGNATFNGASTRDSLTGGQLVIGKNFVQGGPDPESFVADSGFTTTFAGTGLHQASFGSPGAAGSGNSHFGSLSFSSVDPSLELDTDTDLWVEGTLSTFSYVTPTLRNTAGALRTLHVQDVSIQGITFDHLQLHLAKTGLPASGTGSMDIVNFNNFLTTEDQFLVDLPGQPGGFSWSNVTFSQLDTLGGDTGHYIVANDNDAVGPDVLTISLGGNQINDPAIYFVALGGAIINFFAP